MEDNWEIAASTLKRDRMVFDWLSYSPNEGLILPEFEKMLIKWCTEHYGNIGHRWTYYISLGYVFFEFEDYMKYQSRSHPCADKIMPDDIIFIFHHEEDAVEFKLVWG